MELLLNFLNATLIGILSLIIFFLFLYRSFKSNNGKEAPTVGGAWPILGHLPLLGGPQPPHKTFGALADKYGPIFTIKLGAKKALVVNNWEVIRECFTASDMAVSSRPKLIAGDHMGYNQVMFGLAPYGPYWRELRKIVTSEILSNRRVEQLQHVFVSEIRDSIKELFDVWCSKKNESGYVLVDLKQWVSHLTFNIILRMLIGKRLFSVATVNDEMAQRTVKAVKEFFRLFGVFMVGDTIPYLRWFDFGGHEKAMKEAGKELDNIVGEWLEEHRKNRALGEKVDGVQDFMDVMISLFDGNTIDGIDADAVIKSTVLRPSSSSSHRTARLHTAHYTSGAPQSTAAPPFCTRASVLHQRYLHCAPAAPPFCTSSASVCTSGASISAPAAPLFCTSESATHPLQFRSSISTSSAPTPPIRHETLKVICIIGYCCWSRKNEE